MCALSEADRTSIGERGASYAALHCARVRMEVTAVPAARVSAPERQQQRSAEDANANVAARSSAGAQAASQAAQRAAARERQRRAASQAAAKEAAAARRTVREARRGAAASSERRRAEVYALNRLCAASEEAKLREFVKQREGAEGGGEPSLASDVATDAPRAQQPSDIDGEGSSSDDGGASDS